MKKNLANELTAAALLDARQADQRLSAYQNVVIRCGQRASLICGPYLILNKLGDGPLGTCFEAVYDENQPHVCLRQLTDLTPDQSQSIKASIDLVQRVSSPNFQHCEGLLETNQRTFLVSEFLSDANLHAWIVKHGPMPARKALLIMAKAVEAMTQVSEAGLVHGFLQPSKLHIDRRGKLKIRDLAYCNTLARQQPPQRLGLDKSTLHSGPALEALNLETTAPEVLLGTGAASAASDIYSLGTIFFWMLTGRTLFEAPDDQAKPLRDSISLSTSSGVPKLTRRWRQFTRARRPRPSRVNTAIPKPFDAVLLKMVTSKLAKRYTDYPSLHRDLRSLSACVDGTEQPASIKAGRVPRWLAILAVAIAFGAAVAAFWHFSQPQDKPVVPEERRVEDTSADDVFQLN